MSTDNARRIEWEQQVFILRRTLFLAPPCVETSRGWDTTYHRKSKVAGRDGWTGTTPMRMNSPTCDTKVEGLTPSLLQGGNVTIGRAANAAFGNGRGV